MSTGTVKWFDDKKGFGFILEEDGTDIFVHHKNIIMLGRRTLLEGQQVEYEVSVSDGRSKAVNVSVIE